MNKIKKQNYKNLSLIVKVGNCPEKRMFKKIEKKVALLQSHAELAIMSL